MKSIGRLWPQYLPVPKNGESNEPPLRIMMRSEEHTSELQSQSNLVCRLLLEKKKKHPLVSSHTTAESVVVGAEPRQPSKESRCRSVMSLSACTRVVSVFSLLHYSRDQVSTSL